MFKDVGVNFVGRTNVNNGIQGMVDMLEYPPNEGGTISLSQVGTIVSIYQQEPYYTSQNIVKISSSLGISKPVGSYLTTVINKCLKQYVGYNTPKIEDISNLELLLPVKALTDTEPDWEYMEQYIKEIEKKAILKVKEQNEKDIALLKDVVGQEQGADFTEDVEFREFKMSEIFDDFVVGKQPNEKNRYISYEEGMLPVITGVTLNNGTGFYSYNTENTVYENILTISKDGEYAGTPFYQNRKIILGGHSLGCISSKLNRYGYLYIMAELSMYQKEGFWKQGGVMGSVPIKRLLDTKISLPVNKRVSEQVPDWKSIEDYMKHIQQKYISLKEQENETEINNLLTITGLTPKLILSEEGQFA